VGNSSLTDFHLAIGQFLNYRVALKVSHPERKLFLAIPDNTYHAPYARKYTEFALS